MRKETVGCVDLARIYRKTRVQVPIFMRRIAEHAKYYSGEELSGRSVYCIAHRLDLEYEWAHSHGQGEGCSDVERWILRQCSCPADLRVFRFDAYQRYCLIVPQEIAVKFGDPPCEGSLIGYFRHGEVTGLGMSEMQARRGRPAKSLRIITRAVGR